MRIANRVVRRRHRWQRGLTLIEVLVASSIVAVIGLSLGAALSLSVRIIGPNGITGEQVAASSLLTVEGHLSTDVGHAECVTTDGSCPALVGVPLTCRSGFTVCVAWCEGALLRGARYTLSGGRLLREDATSSIVVGRDVVSLNLVASGSGGGPGQLQVSLVAGATRPQRASFTLRSGVTGAAPCA